MPDNPRIVNFDTVTVGTIEVTKTVASQPRTWGLRDDVPSEVLMRFFELGEAAQAEQPGEGKGASAPAQVIASFRSAERIYLAILTDIFRHTYPETTEAEVRAWFTFDQRKQLVDLFFSQAGIGSSELSNATPAGGQDGTPPATNSLPATTPANRAARRSHKRKAT